MTAVIIDDEKNGVELVVNMLQLYAPNINVVSTASSVAQGYEVIEAYKPQLVFLDICMQDGTGFDLLKKFPFISFKVIFITAYETYAVQAFQFSAVDYILKPVSPDLLVAAVKKVTDSTQQANTALKIEALLINMNNSSKEVKKIVLKTAERVYAVGVREIIRCEADGSYTTFYLNDGKKIVVSRSLKEFDEMLTDYNFFRVQQSHLINIDYLDFYEKTSNEVVMKDKSSIPVATRKKDQLLKLIENIG